jgi:ketohexokinase
MSQFLLVGNVTLDIVNTVDHYPHEDEELRALAQSRRRGGNAANMAEVLTRLGQRATLACTLAEDGPGRELAAGLRTGGIDTRYVQMESGGATPVSYITLNRHNGSRTIVHHRDLREYPAAAFDEIPITHYDWLHFEGRNIDALAHMLTHARKALTDQPVSLEIEKPRPGIETLFPLVDVIMFSRTYVEHRGHATPEDFLIAVREHIPDTLLTVTWGEAGAWGMNRDGELSHSEAHRPPAVVDTIGAGDTFNAGLIDALAGGMPLAQALRDATRLAGRKVGMAGFEGLEKP